MPKVIVSIDGIVIKEVELSKERTTLGRRPYNHIVIDNLAVSGEHAVFQLIGKEVYMEDLNSTNGTYVNGKTIKSQQLSDGDSIEIGKYKIKFLNEAENSAAAQTGVGSSSSGVNDANSVSALLRVLSGAAAGREVPLNKMVTTLGKPGVAVASISRRPNGYAVMQVEGANTHPLKLNGVAVGDEAKPLNDGDTIELAGSRMQFARV